jgi:HAD superfamily hydrolase (TIGR01509 family)
MRGTPALPAALLWDVDGTLAETERDGHRVAFNQAFAALGLGWHWDEAYYGGLLSVTGGRERLLHDMRRRADAPADPAQRDALARALHAQKNHFYARLVSDAGICLRPGVAALMAECRCHRLPMGITTTTSRANVDALLRPVLGADWQEGFAVVVCGEDVRRKKPDPQVYLRALQGLVLPPSRVLALEDSPVGVAAALAAGVPVVVTRSVYFTQAPIDGALAVGPGLHTRLGWVPPLPQASAAATAAMVGLEDLRYWLQCVA